MLLKTGRKWHHHCHPQIERTRSSFSLHDQQQPQRNTTFVSFLGGIPLPFAEHPLLGTCGFNGISTYTTLGIVVNVTNGSSCHLLRPVSSFTHLSLLPLFFLWWSQNFRKKNAAFFLSAFTPTALVFSVHLVDKPFMLSPTLWFGFSFPLVQLYVDCVFVSVIRISLKQW